MPGTQQILDTSYVCMLNCLCLNFATLWTAAHQAPPSMGVSRQEHWRGYQLVYEAPEEQRKFFQPLFGSVLSIWLRHLLRGKCVKIHSAHSEDVYFTVHKSYFNHENLDHTYEKMIRKQ